MVRDKRLEPTEKSCMKRSIEGLVFTDMSFLNIMQTKKVQKIKLHYITLGALPENGQKRAYYNDCGTMRALNNFN